MSAIPSPAGGTAAVEHSEGVWHAAWRRFRTDRVGLVSAAVVVVFLLLILLTATRLVASDWQKEVGVAHAPPTFVGPQPPEAVGAIETPKGPNVDLSAIDPLAARYKEWDERAAKFNVEKIKQADLAGVGGAPDEAD